MTHYRMQDGMPSAIILAKNPRTSSLDELRTYNENTIFLNNGNEFQIRLFNPLSEKIGIKIGLNEKYSESFLILNPGQDVTLDRFIDDQKKMLFETYLYDSSNESARKAVVNNGNVTVQFFKEKHIQPTFQSFSGQFFGLTGCTTNTRTIYGGSFGNTDVIYLNDNITNGTLNLTNINGNVGMGCQNPKSTLSVNSCTSTNLTTDNSTYTSGVDMNLDFKSQPRSKSILSKSLKKETGRVEKGTKSDQNLIKVEVEFESNYFYEIVYNLKPVSEKVEVNYDIREYCEKCNYRIRNNKYNFCPKCGNKL